MTQRVHRAGGVKFTGVQIKRLDAKRRRHRVAMGVDPVRHRGRGILGAARERDVRMKRSHIELKSGGEERIVHPLPQLKQSRVAGAGSNPQDSRWTIGRKGAEAFNGQDERCDLHRGESLGEMGDEIRNDVAEKTQRDVELIRSRPCDPSYWLGEERERVTYRRWRREGDEEAFGGHGNRKVQTAG